MESPPNPADAVTGTNPSSPRERQIGPPDGPFKSVPELDPEDGVESAEPHDEHTVGLRAKAAGVNADLGCVQNVTPSGLDS